MLRPFLVLLLAGAASAQSPDLIASAEREASERVHLHIAGYARASTDQPVLAFSLSEEAPEQRQTATVEYATNYARGQRLYVDVAGDFEGVLLQVRPVPGTLVVSQLARRGSAGVARSAVFEAPGARPILEDLGQVVARRTVEYVARLQPGARPGDREIRLVYTVAE